jgi:hypothetical protein
LTGAFFGISAIAYAARTITVRRQRSGSPASDPVVPSEDATPAELLTHDGDPQW